ncbi:Cytochrome p450 [Lasiodiplodia theobromae]|uniref:Cytochrome p450 n=1 Tax=Lasiodiplodia theobromae TaxID=45133 RepID=UPI0015C31C14|nr:Cytochrome p450 [Lasiodiplodia theobromae]KAF4545485.1 Cytochrome p450 [Lasiodiplodia theobromae]
MESSTLVLLFALLCTGAIAISHWIGSKDPREPPLVHPKIPVIGHIIGFIRYGQPYLNMLSAARPDVPIFTVNLLVAKFYVVASPTLISGVQRNHRSLSFEYFINLSASGMLGIKGPGMNLLREEQKGGGGLGMKVTHAMNPALLGAGLDDMNAKMITFLKASVDELASARGSFDLFSWTRHVITVAATESAWGKKNPYRSRELEDAFWTMETNLDKLLFGIMPKLTAKQVWNARESLVEAFVKYYNEDGLEDGSEMAKARWREQQKAGANLQDTARLEAGLALGLLSNTVPATFWTLFEICSRPELLAQIRSEVREKALHVDGNGVHTIDLCDIRDNCELLISTFQETLRIRSKAMPLRMVYNDVHLNDQYLLKAGSIVQMPSPVFHRNESIWGHKSEEFEPRRFIKGGEQKESRRMTGFLAFGISPTLCPGRHFATGEVLSLAAMLLLRYDVLPEGGSWKCPKFDAKSAAASFYTPTEDVPVKFKPRAEYEGTTWTYRVTPGKGRFGLITG